MKRIILYLAFLFITLLANAQNELERSVRNPYFAKVELRATHGVSFQTNMYGEYSEAPRSEGLVRISYGPLFAGAGAGYTHAGEDDQSSVCFLAHLGYKLNIGRLWIDFYGSFEKTVTGETPVPPQAGAELTFAYQITGPFYLLGDIRSEYPLFQKNYGYNCYTYYNYYTRSLTCHASFGLALRF